MIDEQYIETRIIELINYFRQNPKKIAEKLDKEKEELSVKEIANKNRITYKEKFIIPEGKDLFEEVARFLRLLPELELLKPSQDLIMKPQNLPFSSVETTEEKKKNFIVLKEQDDKARYRSLRNENNLKGIFKEYFIFSFVSAESIEDALTAKLFCNFKNFKDKTQRPIEIIFNPNVKYIGVNMSEKKKKLDGYLIFAY